MSTATPDIGEYSSIAQEYAGYALGTGTPVQQIIGTAIIGVVVLVSSTVSFGATLVLLPIVAFWFLVGWIRLVPGVNQYWPL